jgi:site-specific recombinase XerD
MLEQYFYKPDTVDRIRNCWLGEPIEGYVRWLAEKGYAARNIQARVPVLRQFGEFSWRRGARTWEELPDQIEPFVARWIADRGNGRSEDRTRQLANEIRGPVEQLVALVVPSFVERGRRRVTRDPFLKEAPGFFAYLREERGLREASIVHYGHFLRALEAYLDRIGVHRLAELSPAVLSAFVTEASRGLSKTSITGMCCSVRVFLRYIHRESLIQRDLSHAVEGPRKYRLSNVPRSITWDEVRRMLEGVERRSAVGKRDYAILVLLVTYGLRAREISALTLDDIDWERERLLVPERKAGHCTAYPLSAVVGEALLDYLKNARPQTEHRQIFLRVLAPRMPLTWNCISGRASYYLRKAGIRVRRPGSHTLRHTCVQRLIDAEFPLKTIGDYVGHRAPSSTEIYTKVAIESLREVALGDGEALL